MSTTTTNYFGYGYRSVSHLPGGVRCLECYSYNIYPCNKCKKIDYELKEDIMSWEEFIRVCDPLWLVKKCTQIPTTYKEFCDLYDMFHDLPELIYDYNESENPDNESENPDDESENPDDGYDSVS